MCAHIVNRRGYLSLEESYRDEQGRPRKRILRYFGKRAVRERWEEALTIYLHDEGIDWAKWEAEEQDRIRQEELAWDLNTILKDYVFQDETGLALPGSPQDERGPLVAQIEHEVREALLAEPGTPAPPSEPAAPSEPPAEPTADAAEPAGEAAADAGEAASGDTDGAAK